MKIAMSARPTALRYIETSALLAAILEGDAEAVASLRADGLRVTSALTFAEARRTLRRAVVSQRIDAETERQALLVLDTFRERCDVLDVTDDILKRCGLPFPVEPVRTLDAIHLASSASLCEVPQFITVVTRDERVAANARALGFALE